MSTQPKVSRQTFTLDMHEPIFKSSKISVGDKIGTVKLPLQEWRSLINDPNNTDDEEEVIVGAICKKFKNHPRFKGRDYNEFDVCSYEDGQLSILGKPGSIGVVANVCMDGSDEEVIALVFKIPIDKVY